MKAEVGKRYRHYSGKEYIVLGIGHHSETLEEVVVYQGQYDDPEFGEKPIWIRPKEMFEEEIEKDGEKIQRFTLL